MPNSTPMTSILEMLKTMMQPMISLSTPICWANRVTVPFSFFTSVRLTTAPGWNATRSASRAAPSGIPVPATGAATSSPRADPPPRR